MLEETTEKSSESTRIYPLNPRAVLAMLRSEDGSHNITRPNGRLSPTHPAARGRCQLSKARAIDSEEVVVLLWDERRKIRALQKISAQDQEGKGIEVY